MALIPMRIHLIAAVIAAASSAAVLAADNTAALQQLSQQAEFWDGKQRDDRAEEAWQRVLKLDPANSKALSRLAIIAARRGKRGDADDYLNRLRASGASPSLISATEATFNGGSGSPEADALSNARLQARQGQAAAALSAYEKSFSGGKPGDPAIAREYYETMSGVNARYGEARDGLAQLAKSGDPASQLAYARVLTYRADSRRDGIRRLQQLSGQGEASAPARTAWRQALVWLDARPSDEPLLRSYLDSVGDDPQLRTKLDTLGQQRQQEQRGAIESAGNARLKQGFDALEAGNLDGATQTFRSLLATPGVSADARAGLGVVELRRGNFSESAQLLGNALKAKPSLAPRYREAHQTAQFWSTARQGEAANAAGDLNSADQLFRRALDAPPKGGADPSIVRSEADVLVRLNQRADAEKLLRGSLKTRPGDPDLLASLAGVLIADGRDAEAEQLIAAAPAKASGQLDGLRVDLARQQAARLIEAKQYPAAENKLQQALTLAPTSPWVRLDLARLYARTGRTDDADSLLDAITDVTAKSSQGYLAQAYAYSESGRWYETLQALEQIPPADRKLSAPQLQREAWIQYQVQRAGIAARKKDYGNAAEWMGAAVGAAGDDPHYAATIAQGWSSLGDPGRAVAVLRQSFARGNPPRNDERLLYAGLLLQLDQGPEFEAVSKQMIQDGGLSTEQAGTLEDLIVGHRIKLADRAREKGDLAGAYRQLREVVVRYPQQPRVQMALARLFVSAGESDKALAISRALMQQSEPRDDTVFAAIDSALAAGDEDQAEQWMQLAAKRNADPVKLERAAGRLAEARGWRAQALAHYKKADALASGQQELASSTPALVMIDPQSAGGDPLAAPVEAVVDAGDAPVGPLLPRAPDVDPAQQPPAQPPRLRYDRAGQPVPAESPLGIAGLNATSDAELAEQLGLTPPPSSDPVTRLEAATAGYAGAAFQSRSRIGESGLSRLFDFELPIDFAGPEWRGGRFAVRARPVYVDAGEVSGTNLQKFGTLPLIVGQSGNLAQSDSGVALDLAYQLGGLTLDIGTSPLGFALETIVGGANWTHQFGASTLALDFSRRSVTDSYLAYAGAFDPLTGRNWGGVAKTGGRVDYAYDFGDYGLYLNGGYYGLDGRNVQENFDYEVGGGFFTRAYRDDVKTLTIGLNLTTFSYQRNLRFFTLGHGGYFSPQFFGAVTVPIAFTGRWHRLSYSAQAAIGIQSFREDGAEMFPGRAGLNQKLLDIIQQEPATDIPTGYPSQSNTGLGYRLGVSLQYQLTPRLLLGGTTNVDNARDYQEAILMGYLRYYFGGLHAAPPQPAPPSIFGAALP